MVTPKYFRDNFFVSRAVGFGKARNVGAIMSGKNGLMVQFNDDLILSSAIWAFLLTLKPGEFAFQIDRSCGTHVCSRVFAIYLEDFWKVGGFDSNLKYFFEDGDFYHRAILHGLRFREVPETLAIHIPHAHAFYKPKKWLATESEFCMLFVKYNQNLISFSRLDRFFVPFRDYRVAIQHFILRIIFLNYWLLRRLIK